MTNIDTNEELAGETALTVWLKKNFNPLYLPAILIGIDWANQGPFWQGIIAALSLILSIAVLQKSERSVFNKRYRINLLVFILLSASILNLLTILGFSKVFSPDEMLTTSIALSFTAFLLRVRFFSKLPVKLKI